MKSPGLPSTCDFVFLFAVSLSRFANAYFEDTNWKVIEDGHKLTVPMLLKAQINFHMQRRQVSTIGFILGTCVMSFRLVVPWQCVLIISHNRNRDFEFILFISHIRNRDFLFVIIISHTRNWDFETIISCTFNWVPVRKLCLWKVNKFDK